MIKKRQTFNHQIIKKSILEDKKIYVVWYFWTICWLHPHIPSFNVPFDFIFDQCYFLHVKTTSVFVLRNNNFRLIKIFDVLKLSLKINRCEVLLETLLWSNFSVLKTWITSRFGYVLHINQFARTVDLILTISSRYSFSCIPFPRSVIFKNVLFCEVKFDTRIKIC